MISVFRYKLTPTEILYSNQLVIARQKMMRLTFWQMLYLNTLPFIIRFYFHVPTYVSGNSNKFDIEANEEWRKSMLGCSGAYITKLGS